MALRALAVAAFHPPRVGVRVSAYSGGVALALDVGISLAEEERRRRLVASVGEEEKPECVIYTDGGYESGQGGGPECAGWGWVAVEGGDGRGDGGAGGRRVRAKWGGDAWDCLGANRLHGMF